MVRRVVLALCAVLAAVVALSGCGTGNDAVSQGDTFQFVSPGGKTVITYDPDGRKQIAEVSGEDLLTGKRLSLNDPQFANKVVVINVWGSWCGPCRGEAAALEEVYEKYKADGVEFLGINLRDDRQSAQDFVSDRKVGFPSIYDFPGASLAALTTPTSVVPTTIVLDRRHRPAAVFLKSVTADELGAVVARVAAETPEPSAP
ncbi:TlpA family protein disulfide reductase [Gordonia sp. NPDC003376]